MGRAQKTTAKAFATGLIGGAVASWVMDESQSVMSALIKRLSNGGQQRPSQDEPATVKAAEAVSEKVFHHPLNAEQKQAAGSAVHYLYGALIGGLYGILAERWDGVHRAAGVPFGSALWLISDEIAVPAIGLADGPRAYPLPVHASALGAHIVYGVTLEMVRRGLRQGYLCRHRCGIRAALGFF